MEAEKTFVGDYERKAIMNDVDLLAQHICESKDYVHYRKCIRSLEQNPTLYAHLNEFRRKRISLELEEGEEAYKKVEQLQDSYKDLMMDPLVTDYLNTEQRVAKLMRMVYDRIADRIVIDVSYLDDIEDEDQ